MFRFSKIRTEIRKICKCLRGVGRIEQDDFEISYPISPECTVLKEFEYVVKDGVKIYFDGKLKFNNISVDITKQERELLRRAYLIRKKKIEQEETNIQINKLRTVVDSW
jgi:hypothetical protein